MSAKRVLLLILCLVGIVVILLGAFYVFHFSRQGQTTSYSPTQTTATYSVQTSTDLAYGPLSDEVLDQCIPASAPASRPGIIMIHGGGWVGGDKAQDRNICQLFASEGYVVTTINYRLGPRYNWPDQIGDVQLAVRYMRAHAAQTGLDPKRICSLGDSAGAHLALFLDELQTIHPADVATIDPTISPKVNCVVDQFGPADLSRLYRENPSVQENISALLSQGSVQSNASLYADASPVDNIAKGTGPVLIIQGTHDQTVLPDQSQELQQDLVKAGVQVQYISYNGDHEYRGLNMQQRMAIQDQINSFLLSVEHP